MSAEVSTQSNPAEARERAERIRAGIVSLAATLDDIAAAYVKRDWASLDYGSWEEYVAGEFSEARIPVLSREQRQGIVAHLREGALSTRAIATVIGVSHPTVISDLAGGQNLPPAESGAPPPKVTGADGRSYPSSRPRPPVASRPTASPPPFLDDGEPEIFDAEIVEGEDFPAFPPAASDEERAERVRTFLPPSPDGAHLEWRRRFLAEIARCSRLVAEFTAESIAEHADDECFTEFGRIARQFVQHYEAAAGLAAPPAGVVNLAGRRQR